MIAESSIQQVRDVAIDHIVGQYVKLNKKKMGSCPFHNEKSASFKVNANKGYYKCFGCGAGGDVIQFVRKFENFDFEAAVEKIAVLGGITLEYEQNIDKEAFNQQRAMRKSLIDVLTDAHNKYIDLLLKDPKAQEYMLKRGYNQDVWAMWGLAYAPDSWGTLSTPMVKNGIMNQGVALGLIKDKENGHAYDIYRNRIIFPILNEKGDLIGFAGRTIGEADSKTPKYINNAATELYDKSKTLFGLYQAIKGIGKHGHAILVEGYTDVISMHIAGANNTVASCGTALTVEQGRLLKKYTNHIVIMRDSDEAGQKATSRDIELLLPLGFKVDVMVLEGNGKVDPDDMAKQFWAKAATAQCGIANMSTEQQVQDQQDENVTSQVEGSAQGDQDEEDDDLETEEEDEEDAE